MLKKILCLLSSISFCTFREANLKEFVEIAKLHEFPPSNPSTAQTQPPGAGATKPTIESPLTIKPKTRDAVHWFDNPELFAVDYNQKNQRNRTNKQKEEGNLTDLMSHRLSFISDQHPYQWLQ